MAAQRISPESYGAQGDGRTDDRPAFQAALSAIERSGGGTLELTPGRTYRIVNWLELPGNLTLIGNDASLLTWKGFRIRQRQQVRIRGVRCECFVPPGQSSTRTNNVFDVQNCQLVEFRDCLIDGWTPVADSDRIDRQWGLTGIRLQACSDIQVHACQLQNLHAKGLICVACQRISILANRVTNTGQAGISISNLNESACVSGNYLSHNVLSRGDGAIDLYGPNNVDVIIADNDIRDYGGPRSMTSAPGVFKACGIRALGSRLVTIRGNWIECNNPHSFAPVRIGARAGVRPRLNQVVGNSFRVTSRGATDHILRLSNSDSSAFTDNSIIVAAGGRVTRLVLDSDNRDFIQARNGGDIAKPPAGSSSSGGCT